MKKLLISSLLLGSTQFTFASVTSPSIFKEMQSTNPGVVSGRKQRAFSFLAKKDEIKISQDLSSGPLGANSEFEAEVSLTNYSAFYGGQGGGLTLELFSETGSGGRKNTLTESGQATGFTTESTLSLMTASLGLWDGFGISMTKAGAQDKQEYNLTVNGSSSSQKIEADYDLTALTAGIAFNLGVDIGLFYTKADLKSKTEGTGQPDQEFDDSRIGIGIGISSPNLRAEVGLVQNTEESETENGDVLPKMYEFTVEGKLGKLKLGYTGRYFVNGFYLHRGILYNNLAYQTNTEDRLDNTFNFSYGSDSKGHSFSGSVSIGSVESEESQPLIDSDETKYTTTTDSQSISLSYAYIF
jgi:hypothetical protein